MTAAASIVPDLVTVGGLTVDNVIAADGTVGLGQAGGNGAYSAVGALHWVARVGLVSQAVASYPRDVLERLAAGGVDLDGVVFTPAEPTAAGWFIYDEGGDRDERFHGPPEELAAAGFPTDRLTAAQREDWVARLASRQVEGEVSYSAFRVQNPLQSEQVPERFWRARGLHLAPSGLEVMTAMLDHVPEGMIVVADPGWQLAKHSFDALTPVLMRLDAFLPSAVELQTFVPGAAPADGLAVLAQRCPGTVAVKLGPQGAMVWDRKEQAGVVIPAIKVETRDPTGAGDAFCGGYLAGLVETGDPLLAAWFGTMAASRVVTCLGAEGALPVDRSAMRDALARDIEKVRA